MGAWDVPAGPRGVLCHPPLERWLQLAETNARAAGSWEFDVQGVAASRLRESARRRALRLGGQGREPEAAAAPLFVTGHQPELYHPGVWAKAFAVREAARAADGFGLNWVVDHDAGELAAPIPRREGPDDLRVNTRRLLGAAPGRPFETLPVPDPEDAEAFLREVDRDLATLGLARERELFQTFAEGLRTVIKNGPRHGGEVGWRSRRAYEEALGEVAIPDVPLSAICAAPEFLTFFVHWIVHAESFLHSYNRALDHVRAARGIKSRANPFPDLLYRADQGVELPFWGLTEGGIRRKLYVRQKGDELVLSHLEGVFATVPATGGEAAVERLLDEGVAIRPRAVPLTVFTRLFVADVFVHGTGGARYDEVTDEFIRNGFGVEPPAYAVVSATMHLPLPERPVQPSALRALQRKLRDLKFNPQRYAWEAAGVDDELDGKLAVLLREKERLIDEIGRTPRGVPPPGQEPGRGPSAKRVLTRAIESTNAELYRLMAEVERKTQEQWTLWQRKAHSGQVAVRRTYPFFLYHPTDVVALLRNGGS